MGKYYEILLENSEIKLGEEKPLSEIEAGAIASELTATLEKESGATTNVDIVVDQNQNEVKIKGKGVNTGRGAGIVKISYGNTRNIGIDVVETFTITVQAEQENNEPKGTIISPSVTTQKYASGSVIILQTTANEGLKLKDWYDGTNVVGETNQCNYTISKNATITARYEVKKLYGEQVLLNGGNPIIVKTVTERETITNYSIDDNWKLFYIDDDDNDDSTLEYVHLIYGDYYLGNVQSVESVYIPANYKDYSYSLYNYRTSKLTNSVNCKDDGLTLLKYLKNNSSYAVSNLDNSLPNGGYTSWTDLLSALTGQGKALNGKQILVQGAPSITMWVNSWNEQGHTKLALDSTGNDVTGYNIRLDTDDANSNSDYSIILNSYADYSDLLYLPHVVFTDTEGMEYGAVGYWLSSPGGRWNNSIYAVASRGIIQPHLSTSTGNLSTRPVISIKKAEFQALFPNISITKQ